MERARQWQREKEEAESSLGKFIEHGWRHAGEPGAFQSNWHIDCMNDHFEAVLDRQIRRLIVNVPPRHMKSMGSNVFLPAYCWAQDPDPRQEGHGLAIRPGTWRGPGVKFISLSYDATLSTRDNTKGRLLIESDWYQERWRSRYSIRADQNQKTFYENTRGGHRFATSINGRITGHGGDIIIIDDPHNVKQTESEAVRTDVLKTWDEALPTRLNDPDNGAFVIIMQRINEMDLVGHILAKELSAEFIDLTEESAKFTIVCLPALGEIFSDEDKARHKVVGMRTTVCKRGTDEVWADTREDGEPLWEARFSKKKIRELAATLGSYATAGQLQQRPAPRRGGIFDRENFRIVDSVPVQVARRVRSWDLAATQEIVKTDPDWTAGVRMSIGLDGTIYVEHVNRLRAGPHAIQAAIKAQAAIDPPGTTITIPQDPGQAGKFQALDYVKALMGRDVRIMQPTGDKATRATPFSAQVEGHNVCLVRGPWIDAYLDELVGFPTGAHDDQVDASSDAFNYLNSGYSGPLQGVQTRTGS